MTFTKSYDTISRIKRLLGLLSWKIIHRFPWWKAIGVSGRNVIQIFCIQRDVGAKTTICFICWSEFAAGQASLAITFRLTGKASDYSSALSITLFCNRLNLLTFIFRDNLKTNLSNLPMNAHSGLTTRKGFFLYAMLFPLGHFFIRRALCRLRQFQ